MGWDTVDDGENEFTNEDSDRKSDVRNPSSDLDPASPVSASSLPVGATGEAAGAGPQRPDPASPASAGFPPQGKQHWLGLRDLLEVRTSTNHFSKFGSGSIRVQ